jgi:hypothetical protein
MDWKPDGPAQEQLVEEMCVANWLKGRAIQMQTLAFEKMAEGPDPNAIPPDLRLYIRYQTTNENHYMRAFRALQALQKEAKRDAQFVSFQATQPRTSPRWQPRSLDNYIESLNQKQTDFDRRHPKPRAS